MQTGIPIKPDDVAKGKAVVIPNFVIDAFNELIAVNCINGRAKVLQKDVILRILQKNPEVSRQEIFKNHWLDVEDMYKGAGCTWGTNHLVSKSTYPR